MRYVILAALVGMPNMATAESINLYAAGSLRAALTEVAKAFEEKSAGQHTVATTFGASGLLRERIEAGEPAHVFASADTAHPKRLVDGARAVAPVRIFARNRLCALVRGGLDVKSETLLDVMLDTNVRLGTSTPKADPSGDYAFSLFGKAEALKPGAKSALEAKAKPLTGGPDSERAPSGRNQYGWIMETGKADLFLTYCTNAVAAKAEVPSLSIVAVAKPLEVGAEYGLVVLDNAPSAAADLAAFILGPQGQAVLKGYGFGAGD